MDRNIEVLLGIGVSILLVIIGLNSFLDYNDKFNSYYNSALESSNVVDGVSYNDDIDVFLGEIIEGEEVVQEILDVGDSGYEVIVDGVNYSSLLDGCESSYEVLDRVDLDLLVDRVFRVRCYMGVEGGVDGIVYEGI
jgi:hypothetical protein